MIALSTLDQKRKGVPVNDQQRNFIWILWLGIHKGKSLVLAETYTKVEY